jgi:hypothetical protein
MGEPQSWADKRHKQGLPHLVQPPVTASLPRPASSCPASCYCVTRKACLILSSLLVLRHYRGLPHLVQPPVTALLARPASSCPASCYCVTREACLILSSLLLLRHSRGLPHLVQPPVTASLPRPSCTHQHLLWLPAGLLKVKLIKHWNYQALGIDR